MFGRVDFRNDEKKKGEKMRRENFLEGVSCLVGRGRGKMRVFSPQVHQKVFSLKWRENLVVE